MRASSVCGGAMTTRIGVDLADADGFLRDGGNSGEQGAGNEEGQEPTHENSASKIVSGFRAQRRDSSSWEPVQGMRRA